MTHPAARPFRVVLLGPPASGKGTQGRRLAETLALGYLSTGALLREQVEAGTKLGRKAAPILEKGEYLPDELMFPILGEWLTRQTGGWVLDGFPRSVPQAVFLDEWLERNGSRLDGAISLEVPFETLLGRIRDRVECPGCRWSGQKNQLSGDGMCPACGQPAGKRADDSEENFRSRYSEFVGLTQPVIARYHQRHLLFRCDATATQDETAARLLELLPVSVA